MGYLDGTYEGWQLLAVVGIDNPDDWTPGSPDRFIVRGHAMFPPLAAGPENWTSTKPFTAESEHFHDEGLADQFLAKVAIALQQAIDERRAGSGW